MSQKTYYRLATTVFAIISAAHILRALQGWEVTLAGIVIPLWVSWAAAAIAGYLAFRGWQVIQNKH